jgi:hypothetical protein
MGSHVRKYFRVGLHPGEAGLGVQLRCDRESLSRIDFGSEHSRPLGRVCPERCDQPEFLGLNALGITERRHLNSKQEIHRFDAILARLFLPGLGREPLKHQASGLSG